MLIHNFFADAPNCSDFDADAHEAEHGGSPALDKLRARQAQVGDAWGDDAYCKMCVVYLRQRT